MPGDALLLGRTTYQTFAAGPREPTTPVFAARMNSLPKYVASTTLKEASCNNSTIIAGNVAAEVFALKQQPGRDILVAGSATLVDTLTQEGLVDEFRLLLHPFVLGTGKGLFGFAGEHAAELAEYDPALGCVLGENPSRWRLELGHVSPKAQAQPRALARRLQRLVSVHSFTHAARC